MKQLATALTALVASTCAFAQNPPTAPVYVEPIDTGRHSSMPTSNYRRTAAANFDGNFIPDAVIAAGSTVGVVYDTLFTRCYVQLTANVSNGSFAVLRAVTAGGKDRIAVATTGGVYVWTYDERDDESVGAQVANSAYGGSRWMTARDVDADGDVDLTFVTANGGRVTEILDNAGTFEITSGFHVSGAALAEPLQWNGTGELEYAVLTGSAMEIWTRAGAKIATVSTTVDRSLLTVLPDAPRNRVAWISKGTRNNQALNVCGVDSSGSLVSEPMVALGSALGVSGIATTDFEWNGYPDLVLTIELNHYEVALVHKSVGSVPSDQGSFTLADPYVALIPAGSGSELATANTGSVAGPTLADLDCDSNVDLLYPTDAFDQVRSIVSTIDELQDSGDVRPVLDGAASTTTPITNGYDVGLVYDIPTDGRVAAATHLELHYAYGTDNDPMEVDWTTATRVVMALNGPTAQVTWPVISGPNYYAGNPVSHLQARLIQVSGSTVVHAWTPEFALWTGTEDDSVLDGIAMQVESERGWSKIDDPTADAPVYGGAYIQRPRPPLQVPPLSTTP